MLLSLLRLFGLLLPALIPSWRFFKTVAPSPRVEYRLFYRGSWGEWCEDRPRPARIGTLQIIRRLFWNPAWNEQLFMVSCSERLIDTPTVHSAAELARRIAQTLPEHEVDFQFRLVFLSREEDQIIKSVEYESARISRAEALA
ncbi:hypothetical protein [Epibacterium ulvae]|uniref:hypothetical protein n=1 Tax=Epibacterium ulvae TaxID=1156985 RepID=UPI002490D0A8|nr:hypothetical protein [Epibacterium ulvae]